MLEVPTETINIEMRDDVGEDRHHHLVSNCIKHTLKKYGVKSGDVSVLLTDNEKIRELNNKFRGVNTATDVLTFPGPDYLKDILGDIVISIPYAEFQCRCRGNTLESELAFLSVHGALHLLGYNDETEEERFLMLGKMNEVIEELNLPTDSTWHTYYEISEN